MADGYLFDLHLELIMTVLPGTTTNVLKAWSVQTGPQRKEQHWWNENGYGQMNPENAGKLPGMVGPVFAEIAKETGVQPDADGVFRGLTYDQLLVAQQLLYSLLGQLQQMGHLFASQKKLDVRKAEALAKKLGRN